MVSSALTALGADHLRLDTDDLLHGTQLTATVAAGELDAIISNQERSVRLREITAVWWFGVETPAMARRDVIDPEYREWISNETKACAVTVLSALPCRYISHPDQITAASNKIQQLSAATRLGFKHPPLLITSDPPAVRAFEATDGPLVYKTLSHPSLKRNGIEHLVYTSRVRSAELLDDNSMRSCLNQFQTEIHKAIELRVTVVGTEVFCAQIHSQASERTAVDWRRYDLAHTPHFPYRLPSDVERACIDLVRHFELEFGTIDLIKDTTGDYWFLELNPNGLWAWIEMLTGLPISNAIARRLLAE